MQSRPLPAIALVVVAGLATGIVTQFGQSVLPNDLLPIANSISPWLAVAFLIGAAMPRSRWAAIAAAGTLVFALVGYYAMTELRYGIGAGTGSLVRWGIGAAVGGPVFGVAGFLWRHGSAVQRAVGVGLLAAVFIAEGVYQTFVVDHRTVGTGFVVTGLVLPVLLGRSWPDRLRAYALAAPALVLGAVGFAALIWLDGVAGGVR
jgi:hypothetical protein